MVIELLFLIYRVLENQDSDEIALLMHGNPTWGYLYRNMINPLKENGYRVIVPDLPGFGKSDKFAIRYNYTYEGFVDWMSQFVEGLDLKNITLFCQDWGGLIGLRLATHMKVLLIGCHNLLKDLI